MHCPLPDVLLSNHTRDTLTYLLHCFNYQIGLHSTMKTTKITNYYEATTKILTQAYILNQCYTRYIIVYIESLHGLTLHVIKLHAMDCQNS